MGMNTLFIVAALLINEQEEILIAQRPEGKPLAGLWEFPGGKTEWKETPKQALARELKEELDLSIIPESLHLLTSYFYEYPELSLEMSLFGIHLKTSRPKGLEGQTFRWIHPSSLLHYPMPAADREWIPKIPDWIAHTKQQKR